MLGKGWFPDDVGGLERYFRELLEHQPEATAVVVGPARDPAPRVAVISHHEASLPWRLLAFAAASRRASRGADVIDSHFALYAALPLLLSRRVRALPAVVHFQGPWADENVAQGDSSKLRRSLRRGLERRVYRRADRVIVLSSAFRRLLVERYGVLPWRVRVEPPGVDLTRFTPGDRAAAHARFGLSAPSFLAVCVRRLVPRMGLDTLIDAWAQLARELPPGALLFIAGEGPLRGDLEERLARRGVQDSIRLLGRIGDDALVDLYRAADVGIVPTRSFEGFGLVVIEAAACGTPTIVSRSGGLPEAVARLDPALVVPAGDASALAARVVRAAAGELPSREATRAFAERYAWPAVADRNRAVQREAIATPPRAERRLRVVYLDHVAQLSGGEIALLRLVPHLHDVEAHVILAEDGPFADELVQAGVSVEVMALHERARGLRKDAVTARTVPLGALLATIAYVLRLALRLRRLRPDLVHTNSLKAGVYGSIAARLAGVPVVWHVRDRIASDYLPAAAVRAVRATIGRFASAAIANSAETATTLGTGVRTAVVPEAILAPVRRGGRRSGPLTVGMIGRVAPWKGQDLFLRAFAQAFPAGEERCVVVGAPLFGEEDFERRLHELAAELGLGERVEFRGFRGDIWHELARLDLLVHASLVPEPFGQVVLEGMAAGVPVIAADAGGPREIIEPGRSGVLYPIGGEGALAGAMRELALDPERRARLARGGRDAAAAYHPDVIAARMQAVYQEVVGPIGGRP
jgi:glycosyltransferase involved in cell wall biosynthesis